MVTGQRVQSEMRNVITLQATSHNNGSEVTPTMTVDDDSAFLTTPAQVEDSSDISTSFIFPSRSYDVQFSNIKDVIPGWEDDEIDEIVVLSEKQRELGSIDEDQELSGSASETSIGSFEPVQLLSTPLSSTSFTSSNVALFRHTATSSLYAVKTFTKSSISYDTPVLEHAMKEQMILRLLTQMEVTYVLKLRWSFQDTESMRLVTEFCPGGDLHARVTQSGPLNPHFVWLYAAELAEALSSLHTSGICHRSLCPEHVLIGADGHIVLTGFSRASVTAFNSPKSDHRNAIEEKDRLSKTSNMWSAPELILGWSHDFAVDCWGLGVLVYFMLTGQHPSLPGIKLGSGHSIHPRILESAILHGPLQLDGCDGDSDVTDLILKCLERNPRMRLNADDIKDHSYFADIDWTRLHDRGYPAPVPSPRVHEEGEEDFSLDMVGMHESETLRGVHIAGFNYAYDPVPEGFGQMTLSDDEPAPVIDQAPTTPVPTDSCSKTLKDLPLKVATVLGESTYVVPAGSARSSKAGSATTASTALYSCTSFGELRDTLKARPSEKFPLPLSADPDFQSNMADFGVFEAAESGVTTGRQGGVLEQAYIGPAGILLRRDSETTTGGLGVRGLGLRKYASLDFDLDTVVSLDTRLDRGPLNPKETAGISKRRVSFANAMASPTDTLSPDATPLDAPNSPWRNLSKYYLPNPDINKLRKRRTESTPVLSTTPRMQERVELPEGLQQIGLGIGYTYNQHPETSKGKGIHDGAPRRSLSLGATTVARCGALFSNIRRPKGGGGQDAGVQQTERASEESDAMDAVMREMYGSAWNEDTGVGYHDGGGYGRAASSRRHAGRVYSVNGGTDELGSTLRLVQTPSTAVDSVSH